MMNISKVEKSLTPLCLCLLFKLHSIFPLWVDVIRIPDTRWATLTMESEISVKLFFSSADPFDPYPIGTPSSNRWLVRSGACFPAREQLSMHNAAVSDDEPLSVSQRCWPAPASLGCLRQQVLEWEGEFPFSLLSRLFVILSRCDAFESPQLLHLIVHCHHLYIHHQL